MQEPGPNTLACPRSIPRWVFTRHLSTAVLTCVVALAALGCARLDGWSAGGDPSELDDAIPETSDIQGADPGDERDLVPLPGDSAVEARPSETPGEDAAWDRRRPEVDGLSPDLDSVGPRPEPLPETQSEAEGSADLDAETTVDGLPETDMELEATADAKLEATADAELEATADAELDAAADAELDAGLDAEIDAAADAELYAELYAGLDTEADAEPEAETNADSYEPLVGFAGAFSLTYYYLVYESAFIYDSEGQELPNYPVSTLKDTSCAPLASVATSFADAICVEGSGVIRDGSVLNLDNDCACGHPCPNGRHVCFELLDPLAFPHGMGAMGDALEPLRSVATDTDVLDYGTVIYLPDWDGLLIPDVDGLGAFVHDGCFRAVDVGQGVDNYHLDIFAGSVGMWQALEWYVPTGSALPVYVDPGRCQEMRNPATVGD